MTRYNMMLRAALWAIKWGCIVLLLLYFGPLILIALAAIPTGRR